METPEKKIPEAPQVFKTSQKNKKRKLSQRLKEMPYTDDKVGQTFIMTTSGSHGNK